MPITGRSGARHLDLRVLVLERVCRQANTTRFSNAREAANVTRAQGGAAAPASTPRSHRPCMLVAARRQRRAARAGAETLRRSASSKRPPACRTGTTPRPTTQPQYFSDSCHLTHIHHAWKRTAPARSRRRRCARPVCADDPRGADGGRRRRRAAEAVRVLRHDRRDQHRRVSG
jgi:hypothetical protein